MSSALLPPRETEGEGATLIEAKEFGLMMSLTGWFGPACLYSFRQRERERESKSSCINL